MRQVGVVVPPDDVLSLADAIVKLANDHEQMKSLGLKGLSWVVENWSKEKVLNNYFEYMGNNFEHEFRNKKRP